MQQPDYPQDDTPSAQETFLLKQTWKHQVSAALDPRANVDVDKECLAILEEKMFEVSSREGKASLWQWGLDAGDHQDAWDPYANLPSAWNFGDIDYEEDDVQASNLWMPSYPVTH